MKAQKVDDPYKHDKYNKGKSKNTKKKRSRTGDGKKTMIQATSVDLVNVQ